MRPSLIFCAAALLNITVAHAETPSPDLSAVPPALESSFAKAIRAWHEFSVRERDLDGRLRPRWRDYPWVFERGSFGDPDLHRYLYPWAQISPEAAPPDDRIPARPSSASPVALEPVIFRSPRRERPNEGILTLGPEETWPDAIASAKRESGKWYWEVRYHPKRSSAPFASLLGISNPSTQSSDDRILGLPENLARALHGGETLQFALDLEQGAFHIGVGGGWLLGDPRKPKEGVQLAPGRSYAPAVHARRSERDPYEPDIFTFNFGASPFLYRVPEGFEPYDIRYKEARLAESKGLPANAPTRGLVSRHDAAIGTSVAKLMPRLTSDDGAALERTIQSWRAYRDAACALNAEYRGLGGEPDLQCLGEFTGSLQRRLAKAIEALPIRGGPLNDLPAIAPKSRVHYVEIYRAGEGGGREAVDVRVSDTNGPLVLFLRAHEPVEWRVKLAPKVKVSLLLLYGQNKQTATVSGKIESIRSFSVEEKSHGKIWEKLSKGKDSRLDLAEAIQALLGVPAATMQFECPAAVCTIDGHRTWQYQRVSTRSGNPVVWVQRGDPSPGKRAENRIHTSGALVRASEARDRGRWYFELEAGPLSAGKKAWAGGTVGVVDASSSDKRGELRYRDGVTAGGNSLDEATRAALRRIGPGSVVNVALDLDKASVYYGVDGKWIVGNPVSDTGGRPLKKGRDYFPAIDFSVPANVARDKRVQTEEVEPGTWIGRFAAPEFKFAAPPGYLPYESNP